MFVAIIALGAVAGFGQNPCEDADGQAALDKKFRDNYPAAKPIADRKAALEAGKQFLEKYGSCEPTKEFSDYLKGYLPKLEASIKKKEHDDEVAAIRDRFLAGIKSKTWDDVYATGKQLLAENADDYRAVELVLGSIGLDETAKSPRVTKWNDDTLRFAKQSIADLDGGKKFSQFGIAPFIYKDKGDALGWMNFTVGFILAADKGNKKDGAVYLYRAAQATSDTKSNSVVYEWIGAFYFDDAKRLIGEVKAEAAKQKDMESKASATDTPEVKQQKLDALKVQADVVKAKVGILNGTVERALDAYSRAYSFAPNTPAGKTYQANIKTTLSQLYNVRFEKTDGLDAYIAAVPAKPLPDPASTITPVLDPETVTTGTSVGVANGSGVGTSNGAGVGAANGNGIGSPGGKPGTSATTATPNGTTSAKPGPKKPN